MADMSSCWCLCGGDSEVGVAAGSFSIAVDESVLEVQSSYRAIHLQATERLGAGSMCLTRLGEGEAGGEGASLSMAGV